MGIKGTITKHNQGKPYVVITTDPGNFNVKQCSSARRSSTYKPEQLRQEYVKDERQRIIDGVCIARKTVQYSTDWRHVKKRHLGLKSKVTRDLPNFSNYHILQ